MFIEILLFLFSLVLLLFYVDRKPKGLPPGPWGVPILGDCLDMKILRAAGVRDMIKKHGSVFGIRKGSRFLVFVSDFELFKSALNNPDMQGRPDFYTFRMFTQFQNLGFIASDGELWSYNRRFALRHLRDLGMGKSRIQTSIQNEAGELIKHFRSYDGKPSEITHELNLAVLNVIWQLVAGRRYEVNDEKMLNFMDMMSKNVDSIQGPIAILNVFPWVEKILPTSFLNEKMKLDVVKKQIDSILDLIKENIDEHIQKLDEDSPEDYIDHFLLDKERKYLGVSDYQDLAMCIGDFFVAGSETTSSTLRWYILLMAKHPEEHKKLQKMIDEIVPRDRLPSLEDRNDLVYFDAALMETMRFSSLVPRGVPHRATAECRLGKYIIPKDSVIISLQGYWMRNAKYFEKPDEFYPNHFIGENGELLTKKPGYSPFSVGRRQCLGESLAKAELFLFASAISQNFDILPGPGEILDLEFDRKKPLFNTAKPFKVCFVPREM